ncbi:hypothetical protein EAH69_01700 [Faecalibacter macacae]|uniref:Uncharacterized protein n=1 Tax=Faecalibacter macacae TaxID=1859289 RepID=A0A3L9MHD7_9FLAO|nr:hypothetical protein EAH69_01700 [Faecalibacter macacae]
MVCTIIAPEYKSPYSTDGIPRITSTLSILSAFIWRKSAPPPLDVENEAFVPAVAEFVTCKLALFYNDVPLTITEVPKDPNLSVLY